jgi:hypothetical protein
MRVICYGGGVQSTALLVLAAQGRIDYKTFLFCNVGDDSEHPDTLSYVDKVAKPYAEENGLNLIEIRRTKRDGTQPTLYGEMMQADANNVPIPVRMTNGAPGSRSCTVNYKIAVVRQWVRKNGATEANPAYMGMGISLDEVHRMHNKNDKPYERRTYPLIEDFAQPLTRNNCETVIREAGLVVPPKSACWFCPFLKPSNWAEMRRDHPALFLKCVELERTINAKRVERGLNLVWLTRFNKPLDVAIAEAQEDLFGGLSGFEDDAECDNGVCFV